MSKNGKQKAEMWLQEEKTWQVTKFKYPGSFITFHGAVCTTDIIIQIVQAKETEGAFVDVK